MAAALISNPDATPPATPDRTCLHQYPRPSRPEPPSTQEQAALRAHSGRRLGTSPLDGMRGVSSAIAGPSRCLIESRPLPLDACASVDGDWRTAGSAAGSTEACLMWTCVGLGALGRAQVHPRIEEITPVAPGLDPSYGRLRLLYLHGGRPAGFPRAHRRVVPGSSACPVPRQA